MDIPLLHRAFIHGKPVRERSRAGSWQHGRGAGLHRADELIIPEARKQLWLAAREFGGAISGKEALDLPTRPGRVYLSLAPIIIDEEPVDNVQQGSIQGAHRSQSVSCGFHLLSVALLLLSSLDHERFDLGGGFHVRRRHQF